MSGKARHQPDLLVGSEVLGDSGIRGLIDEWLAAAIADRVVQDLCGAQVKNKE